MKTKKINTSNLKFIRKSKIKELLNNPSVDSGKDYSLPEVVEALSHALWDGTEKELDKELKRQEKEYWEYQDFLDSEGVPPIPAEYFENYFNKVG